MSDVMFVNVRVHRIVLYLDYTMFSLCPFNTFIYV